MMDSKKYTVKNGDVEIHGMSFGTGSRPLLLIQGLRTNDTELPGFIAGAVFHKLAVKYRVYMADRRSVVNGSIDIRTMAEDYAVFMKELGVKDAYVIGVSQGGMIAQYLAVYHPELVSKLVLAVTASRSNSTIESSARHWEELTEKKEYDRLFTDMMTQMYTKEYTEKYRYIFPLAAKISRPKDPERFKAMCRSIMTCDIYDRLDEIKCPVLVIGGRLDNVTTPEAAEEIAEKLGCEIYMYENYGHSLYDEAKDFYQRAIDFFDK